jgi:hypothetical protein
MSSFVAFGSRQISHAERSSSSFDLVVSCLFAGEDPPSPPTKNHRCRSSNEGHSSLGPGEWTYCER